jgi:UDP-glucose 4-epimerase
VTVKVIAEEVVAAISPSARIEFGEGNRGWVGDVPRFSYSISKLAAIGWCPKLTSLEAIKKAIQEIALQEKIL